MKTPALHQSVAALGVRLHQGPLHGLRLRLRPIRAGLEDSDVAHVTALYQDERGLPCRWPLVVKHLRGQTVREAAVYQGLVAAHASGLSPRLLGLEQLPTGDVLLFLEALRPLVRWPWRDIVLAAQVLDRLAGLHSAQLSGETRGVLAAWDYESELQSSAGSTIELLMRCGRDRRLPALAGTHRPAFRVALAIGAMRRELLSSRPFGGVALHGDMHPGNALVCRRSGTAEPAFLDWGRARIGSALEDVSSWLQSLGYWEPEARRRHDTLLAGYLRARGGEVKLERNFRSTYWLAGASNALSGALRYHLSVALDPRTSRARRARAVHSAQDWLRVLRRADACWN